MALIINSLHLRKSHLVKQTDIIIKKLSGQGKNTPLDPGKAWGKNLRNRALISNSYEVTTSNRGK
jgi:hypothetical protein